MSLRNFIDIVGQLNQSPVTTTTMSAERLDEFSFRDMFRRKNAAAAPQQPAATPAAPAAPAPAQQPVAPAPTQQPASAEQQGRGDSTVQGLQYAVNHRNYQQVIQRLKMGRNSFPRYADWFTSNLNQIETTQWGEDWEKEEAWKRFASQLEGKEGADLLRALNSPNSQIPRR